MLWPRVYWNIVTIKTINKCFHVINANGDQNEPEISPRKLARRRAEKDSERAGAKRKPRGEVQDTLILGWNIPLLDGSQHSATGPSGEGSKEVKTLQCWQLAALDRLWDFISDPMETTGNLVACVARGQEGCMKSKQWERETDRQTDYYSLFRDGRSL
jgi:hypothetical protein